MKANGKTVNEILINLPEDRVKPFNKLHDVIVEKPARRFRTGTLVMVDWVMLFLTLDPAGYHCKAKRAASICENCFARKFY